MKIWRLNLLLFVVCEKSVWERVPPRGYYKRELYPVDTDISIQLSLSAHIVSLESMKLSTASSWSLPTYHGKKMTYILEELDLQLMVVRKKLRTPLMTANESLFTRNEKCLYDLYSYTTADLEDKKLQVSKTFRKIRVAEEVRKYWCALYNAFTTHC